MLANPDAADLRDTDMRSLVRTIKGDLDHIVLTALEPDRTRRYGSVVSFADDIYRYLSGFPVRAGSRGNAYYIRRFLHRYRKRIALASTLFLILLSTGLFLLRDLQQTRSVEVEEMRSAMALELAFDLIEDNNPFVPGEIDPVAFVDDVLVKLRDIGDEALPPVRRGKLFVSLAAILQAYNEPEKERALLLHEQGRELFDRSGLNRLDPDRLWAANLAGKNLIGLGRNEEAEALLVGLVRDLRENGPEFHLRGYFCEGLHGLALLRIRQGRYREAEEIFSELRPLQDEIMDSDETDRLSSVAG